MLPSLTLPRTPLVGGKTFQYWADLFFHHMQSIDAEFDPGHRIDHVLRVAKTAIELAKVEGALLEVVLPAIILHDTVPVGKFSKDRAKASEFSAQHSMELLKSWRYPAGFYPAITHAILTHSFSAGLTPLTLEAKVVQDADRLDALGASGIARTMAIGFKNGNTLYNLQEPFPRQRNANDAAHIIDHFYLKLFRLPASMQTETGKHEAISRIKIMEDYLQALASELNIKYLSYEEYICSPDEMLFISSGVKI